MEGIPDLDPEIHQPTRLKIMALLYRNRAASFTWVRDRLGLTDGNLASHAGRLEAVGYLTQKRALTARGFQVQFKITKQGDDAFRRYLGALRGLVALDEATPRGKTGVTTRRPDSAAMP